MARAQKTKTQLANEKVFIITVSKEDEAEESGIAGGGPLSAEGGKFSAKFFATAFEPSDGGTQCCPSAKINRCETEQLPGPPPPPLPHPAHPAHSTWRGVNMYCTFLAMGGGWIQVLLWRFRVVYIRGVLL